MTRQYVYLLSALFAGIGLMTFVYKWQALGFPLSDNQQSPAWTIETSVRFDSGPGSIKVNLQIPSLTPGFGKLSHYPVSRNFGFGENQLGGGRQAQWTVRRADASGG